MPNIYDEQQEMHSVRAIMQHIHEMCNKSMMSSTSRTESNYDDMLRRSKLIVRWPSDDLVCQIIKDTIDTIREYDLDVDEIKW